jgi:hypothetical protein
MTDKILWKGNCPNEGVTQDVEKFVLIYLDSNVRPLPPDIYRAYCCVQSMLDMDEAGVSRESEGYIAAKTQLDLDLKPATSWLKKAEDGDFLEPYTLEHIENNLPKFDRYEIVCPKWQDNAFNEMVINGNYWNLEYRIGEIKIFPNKDGNIRELFAGERHPIAQRFIMFSDNLHPTFNVGIRNVSEINSGGMSDFFDPDDENVLAEYERLKSINTVFSI